MEQKHPLPPFTKESALLKVQLAEDGWKSKDPERFLLAYSIDIECSNRTDFISGREAVKAFLKGEWEKALDYKLKKELYVKGLSMNIIMLTDNGSGLMEMKIGSLMKMD